MLDENDMREIKNILDTPETGGWFSRRRQRNKKKELINSLNELDFATIELYNAKVQQQIDSIRERIKNMNSDPIPDSVPEIVKRNSVPEI